MRRFEKFMHNKCIGLCRNVNLKNYGHNLLVNFSLSLTLGMFKLSCSSFADKKTTAVYWIELPFTHKNGDFHNRTNLHCADLESGFRVFNKV